MTRYKVIACFKDKYTGEFYEIGETFLCDDPERVASLRRRKFIGAAIDDERPAANDPSVLDGSIPALMEALSGITDVKELERLLAMEHAGKTRKGAIAALEARIAACRELA